VIGSILIKRSDGKYLGYPDDDSYGMIRHFLDDTSPSDRAKKWPNFRDKTNDDLPKKEHLPEALSAMSWLDAPTKQQTSAWGLFFAFEDRPKAQLELQSLLADGIQAEMVEVDDFSGNGDTVSIAEGKIQTYYQNSKLWTPALVEELLVPIVRPWFYDPNRLLISKEELESLESSDPRLIERRKEFAARKQGKESQTLQTLRECGYDGSPLSSLTAQWAIIKKQVQRLVKETESFLRIYAPAVADGRYWLKGTSPAFTPKVPRVSLIIERHDDETWKPSAHFVFTPGKVTLNSKKLSPTDIEKTLAAFQAAKIKLSAHDVAEIYTLGQSITVPPRTKKGGK
jgi:hypothetical protein